MHLHRTLVGAALLAGSLGPLAASGQDAGQPDLPAQVLAIFQTKCIKCHGPDVKRPKGKFGYVTNLARVAANPAYIVPLNPAESELYLLVQAGEMPPAKSDIEPLDVSQLEAIDNWILAGASAPQTDSGQPMPTIDAATGDSESIASNLRRWAGRMHPAAVHLPIGMLWAAALADLVIIVSGQPTLRPTVRFCLLVGTIGAVVAACLGWLDAETPRYASKSGMLLALHRWTGIGAAVCCVVALGLAQWQRRLESPRAQWITRIVLFLAVGMMSVAAFLGGANVYGLEHIMF